MTRLLRLALLALLLSAPGSSFAVSVSDNFNRGNSSDLGSNWRHEEWNGVDGLKIDSNQATGTSGVALSPDMRETYNTSLGNDDHCAQIKIQPQTTNSAHQQGLVLRNGATDQTHYLVKALMGGQIMRWASETTGGVPTTIQDCTMGAAWEVGDYIGACIRGADADTQVWGWRWEFDVVGTPSSDPNDWAAPTCIFQNNPATAVNSGTYAGIYLRNGTILSTQRMDNFSATSIEDPFMEDFLVLHYTFDDSGDLGADSSSPFQHATISGTFTQEAAGKFGGAGICDGSTSRVNTLWSTEGFGELSWGGWIRPDNTATQANVEAPFGHSELVSIADHTTASVIGACILDSTTGVGGAVAQGCSSLVADTWYHLFCTFDGTTIRSYCDGAAGDTALPGAGVLESTTQTLVACEASDGTSPYPGDIDDWRFYSRTLAASDVEEFMCGDGVAQAFETCDELNNDGCAPGETCPAGCQTPCVAAPGGCGDGSVDPPEVCDPAAASSVTCEDVGCVGPEIVDCNLSCSGYDATSCVCPSSAPVAGSSTGGSGGGRCEPGQLTGENECVYRSY